MRTAQGPKSREFHFKAPLCTTCNSTRTQRADRAFDRFHEEVANALTAGHDPATVFDLEQYAAGSPAYLDVFRYFAKLLSCHIAESQGPRSIQIGKFAIGESDTNPILLHIDTDPTYLDFAALAGEHQYAAHGGLVVTTDPESDLLDGFRTSLTLGVIRYCFWVKFGLAVALAIRLFHKPFADKCMAAYRAALAEPMSPRLRNRLGV